MTTNLEAVPDADALVERLFGATVGALELLSVHVGWRLGLYRILADGTHTVNEFAAYAGIDERYATEWLEQQAAAGILHVVGLAGEGEPRRYHLPAAYRGVLVDPEDPAHVAPFAPMVVGIAAAIPDVVEAYRTGAGVPYPRYGADFRDGQGAINRPAYHHDLAGWIAAMPDIAERLRAGGRTIDLGCGQGWSTLALARAFPAAAVVGVDNDKASIDDAQLHAERSPDGGPTNLAFRHTDAAAIDDTADLVCIFEALHDMADPVGVLRIARDHLSDAGAVLVVDERVDDEFRAPADEVERMMYGWSVLHCLPASRAEQPSAALGTVLRRPTVSALAAEAGFSRFTELPVEHDFFRFYRLDA